MCFTGKLPVRSWMFIYAGFVASLFIVAKPTASERIVESPARPAVIDAKMQRTDF